MGASDDKWNKEVTNSKIALAMVATGLVVSFTIISVGDILKGAKNIITKPIFRKKKNVRRSSDLY